MWEKKVRDESEKDGRVSNQTLVLDHLGWSWGVEDPWFAVQQPIMQPGYQLSAARGIARLLLLVLF